MRAKNRHGLHPLTLSANDISLMKIVKYVCNSPRPNSGIIPGLETDRNVAAQIAMQKGNDLVLQLLTNELYGTDEQRPLRFNPSQNPLHPAALRGDFATVHRLLDEGEEPDALDKGNGVTPLFLASWNGHETIVELLLQKGANVKYKNPLGLHRDFGPLHKAAVMGHTAVVETLLQRSNERLVDEITSDGSSDTALILAAREGHLETVSTLIKHDAKVNLMNSDKKTALHIAAEGGHADIVCSLVDEWQADPAPETKGHNFVSLIVTKGNDSLLRRILDLSTNEDKSWQTCVSPSTGRTLLHVAVDNLLVSTVDILLSAGADVNAQIKRGSEGSNEEEGWTALHLAAAKGLTDVAIRLLSWGAFLTLKSKEGETPIQVAQRYGGGEQIIEALEKFEEGSKERSDGSGDLEK